jgi:predicted acyltransferase
LLSTLPALATTLLGLLTGVWLLTSHTLARKARGIAVAGLSCAAAGGLWNLSFPINKKLWTSSYVLFAGGLSLLLLALSIWIVDVRTAKQSHPEVAGRSPLFTPLRVFGSNAITAYVFSELLGSAIGNIHTGPGVNLQQTLYRSIHVVVPDPAFASLLYSLGFVLICWLATYPPYRQKIFIKI